MQHALASTQLFKELRFTTHYQLLVDFRWYKELLWPEISCLARRAWCVIAK
jgi:hypothetical protein